MDNEKLGIQKFSRYVLLGQLVSVGLLILGGIFVLEKQAGLLQITGWIFILMGLVFILAINQRRQRLLWIYKNTVPTAMKMKLEKKADSDSTQYYAYLIREDKNIPEGWKTSLYGPSFDIQLFLAIENPVQVYFDPKNNTPAVIKTTHGLLWVVAGSGAVQKLQSLP
jgi:hypothetical protein